MNLDLYNKYGEYNEDGYYIEDHNKWHYYAERPNLYKKKKKGAARWEFFPFLGFLIAATIYEEMGLSCV